MAQAKKAATKKAPVKRVTTKKPVAPRAKASSPVASSALQSFRLTPNEKFLQFQVTQQTVYWLVISVLVIALAAYILFLQFQINAIYDSIQVSNSL